MLDLTHIKKVDEFPTHFVAHHASGQRIPVPKDGLHPDAIAEIQAFAKGVQKFSGENAATDPAASEVQPVASTEAAPEDEEETPAAPPLSIGPTSGAGVPLVPPVGPPGDGAPQGVPAVNVEGAATPEQQQIYDAAISQGKTPVEASAAAGIGSISDSRQASGMGPQSPALTPEQEKIYSEYIAKGGSEKDALTAAGVVAPAEVSGGASTILPTEPAGPPVPSPMERMSADIDAKIQKLMGTTPGGGPSYSGEVGAAFKQQNEALQNEAIANANYYRDKADLDRDTATKIAESNKVWAVDRARNEQLGDALANAIRTSKIDPNRIFNDPATGGANTMLATLGSALGAFGATLGHTQNFAQDIINKTIDRDIAAQRDDLGKNQSMLSYYMAKGRDIDSAYALTKANMLDAAAGQALQLADRLGASKASDDAKFQAGALRTQAAQIRSNLQTASVQRSALVAQLQAQKLQQLFTQKWMVQMTGGGGAGQLDPQEGAIMMGGPEAYLKHGFNVTRPVADAAGAYRPGVYAHYQGLLTDPTLRAKATEEYRTQREQSDRLVQLERLYAVANNRPLTFDERALAHQAAADWAQGQAHANIDTTRFTPLEHKLSDELNADPDNWLDLAVPSRASEKLKAARDMQMKMFDSLDDAYLTRNFRRRT